jgi:hypothetical protein
MPEKKERKKRKEEKIGMRRVFIDLPSFLGYRSKVEP